MKPYARHNGIILYHGDVLETMKTLPADSIDLIATSPPYNCRKLYDASTDERPWPDYYAWMGLFLDECYRVLCLGGTLAINMPGVIRYQHDHAYRHIWHDFDKEAVTHRQGVRIVGRGRIEPVGFRLQTMMFTRDSHIREPIVWVKGGQDGQAICTSYQMGSDNNPYLRPCHEFIWLGSKGQWHHRGGTGRRGAKAMPFVEYTKDTWHIMPKSHQEHPAVWPAEIPRRLIKLFCHAHDAVILDPFSGKGTTMQVVQELGLRGIGVDISQKYCEIAAAETKIIRTDNDYKW